MKLYSYWRSSAAYRVRIALNLKGLDYEVAPVHLLKDGGEQLQAEYQAINPQGVVPALVDGDVRIGQSLAIIDYLETRYPEPAPVPTVDRRKGICPAVRAGSRLRYPPVE